MIDDSYRLIGDFIQVARLTNLVITLSEIRYQRLPCPHKPTMLPDKMQAVYVFSLPAPFEMILKVGKVGPNSNARFLSQHYNPSSSKSNLAKSLLGDDTIWGKISATRPDENQIGEWIKRNLDRENFFLSAEKGNLLLGLFEIFLQCRLHPRYEG